MVFTLKPILLITGPSGIGKTSILRRTVTELKNRQYDVGGMICREVREAGVRVGFEIIDLSTGSRGWLAHVNQPTGPKIGKYRVNITDLEVIGVGAVLNAVQNADIVAVDEIGPMELSSTAFNDTLVKAVESSKPMLGTIHYGLSNSLVNSIKTREEAELLKVTYENREDLHIMIANRINEHLTGSE
ncbi:MAG: NTPase [Candidatus Bathyarchaeota archaeon]|nr:NTPase [Candidatus Bathyarchaeum sp.]